MDMSEEDAFDFSAAMVSDESEGFSFADAMACGDDQEDEQGEFNFAGAMGAEGDVTDGFSFVGAVGNVDEDDDAFMMPSVVTAQDPEAGSSAIDGASAGEAMNSVDLLSSLLAGANMEDAIKKKTEPEPEPEKPKKKKNKRSGKRDPKAMMKALKEAQNASDAGDQDKSIADSSATSGGTSDTSEKFAHTAASWPKLRTSDAEYKTIVIDSGRSKWRIGLEGEAEPRFVSAEAKEGVLSLEDRWAELEAFLVDHCGGMGAASEHAVLFTVPVLENSDGTGQYVEMATIAFGDRFKFARVCIASQEVLCMYASGVPTGLVLNLGVSFTCVPIFEGYILETGINRMDDDPVLKERSSFSLELVALLTDLILSSVMSSPIDTRSHLLANIVIAGEYTNAWTQDEAHTLECYLQNTFARMYHDVERGTRAEVLADFFANEDSDSDLSLSKGDFVVITEKHDAWYVGFVEGLESTIGMFPSNHVKLVNFEARRDFAAQIKISYQDKYGRTRYKDEKREFLFNIDLPSERANSAWLGGSVLACSEGWSELWSSSVDDLKPTVFFPRNCNHAALWTRDKGVVTASQDRSREAYQSSVDLVAFASAWVDWLRHWQSQTVERKTKWFFTNSPTSAETSGSRFESLSDLSLNDRFGEPLPEGKRCQFFYRDREARIAEFSVAMGQVEAVVKNLQATLKSLEPTDGWHAVLKAQRELFSFPSKVIRTVFTPDTFGVATPIKWYGWEEGEPTITEIKEHLVGVCCCTQCPYFIDPGSACEVTSLRAVGPRLNMSATRPVEEVVEEDDSNSDSDDDSDIEYDELPPNVQGMSIFEQIAWKKEELARRRASRAAKSAAKVNGMSEVTADQTASITSAGDAGLAMLEAMTTDGSDAAEVDGHVYSDDDLEGDQSAGGLSEALFDSLLTTASSKPKNSHVVDVSGEMDFDAHEHAPSVAKPAIVSTANAVFESEDTPSRTESAAKTRDSGWARGWSVAAAGEVESSDDEHEVTADDAAGEATTTNPVSRTLASTSAFETESSPRPFFSESFSPGIGSADHNEIMEQVANPIARSSSNLSSTFAFEAEDDTRRPSERFTKPAEDKATMVPGANNGWAAGWNVPAGDEVVSSDDDSIEPTLAASRLAAPTESDVDSSDSEGHALHAREAPPRTTSNLSSTFAFETEEDARRPSERQFTHDLATELVTGDKSEVSIDDRDMTVNSCAADPATKASDLLAAARKRRLAKTAAPIDSDPIDDDMEGDET
eukprot:SAG31_NODE_2914_length_4918_cov_4.809504_2_plen_1248_part_00